VVAQGAPQDDDAPEDGDGVVVPPLASGASEGVEELGVGERLEESPDGAERGAVLELVPGEQGLCGGDDHHGWGPSSAVRGGREAATQGFPTGPGPWAKKREN